MTENSALFSGGESDCRRSSQHAQFHDAQQLLAGSRSMISIIRDTMPLPRHGVAGAVTTHRLTARLSFQLNDARSLEEPFFQ
jgi:hypothetical protein